MDETFIGGKARNMHMDVNASAASPVLAAKDKTIVFGHWNVAAKFALWLVPDRKRRLALQA